MLPMIIVLIRPSLCNTTSGLHTQIGWTRDIPVSENTAHKASEERPEVVDADDSTLPRRLSDRCDEALRGPFVSAESVR